MVDVTSAYAAPVTLHFSGTVDLTSAGLGPGTFSGFYTWESDAEPFEEGESPGEMVYDIIAYQMIFNGVDYTLPVVGNGDGNGVSVADNADVFGDGGSWDGLAFFAALPAFPGLENNLIFAGLLLGPTTMFDSTALPGNLDFLSQVSKPGSLWFEEDSGELASGTFVASRVTTVPEPSTLALVMLGAVGAIGRAAFLEISAAARLKQRPHSPVIVNSAGPDFGSRRLKPHLTGQTGRELSLSVMVHLCAANGPLPLGHSPEITDYWTGFKRCVVFCPILVPCKYPCSTARTKWMPA